MDDAGWTDRFIRHLEIERRLSPLTCKNYRRDLEALAAWLESSGVEDWRHVDAEHIRAFSAACFRKGPRVQSILSDARPQALQTRAYRGKAQNDDGDGDD